MLPPYFTWKVDSPERKDGWPDLCLSCGSGAKTSSRCWWHVTTLTLNSDIQFERTLISFAALTSCLLSQYDISALNGSVTWVESRERLVLRLKNNTLTLTENEERIKGCMEERNHHLLVWFFVHSDVKVWKESLSSTIIVKSSSCYSKVQWRFYSSFKLYGSTRYLLTAACGSEGQGDHLSARMWRVLCQKWANYYSPEPHLLDSHGLMWIWRHLLMTVMAVEIRRPHPGLVLKSLACCACDLIAYVMTFT